MYQTLNIIFCVVVGSPPFIELFPPSQRVMFALPLGGPLGLYVWLFTLGDQLSLIMEPDWNGLTLDLQGLSL